MVREVARRLSKGELGGLLARIQLMGQCDQWATIAGESLREVQLADAIG